MKNEYDFSKAAQGRFHRPGARGEEVGQLVNQLLKKNQAGRIGALTGKRQRDENLHGELQCKVVILSTRRMPHYLAMD